MDKERSRGWRGEVYRVGEMKRGSAMTRQEGVIGVKMELRPPSNLRTDMASRGGTRLRRGPLMSVVAGRLKFYLHLLIMLYFCSILLVVLISSLVL